MSRAEKSPRKRTIDEVAAKSVGALLMVGGAAAVATALLESHGTHIEIPVVHYQVPQFQNVELHNPNPAIDSSLEMVYAIPEGELLYGGMTVFMIGLGTAALGGNIGDKHHEAQIRAERRAAIQP